MKILRTPDECFDNLEDYPFEPNYIDLEHHGKTLRMHYLDENSESEEIVLPVSYTHLTLPTNREV